MNKDKVLCLLNKLNYSISTYGNRVVVEGGVEIFFIKNRL